MDSSNSATAIDSYTLAKKLRSELKQWEQSFAAAHQGRRARREDIKQHPSIAHKYKQYDRLRRSPKGSATDRATPMRKRPTDPCPVPSSRSPYKLPKHTRPIQFATTRSHGPTSPQHLSPRTVRTSIGPTPQKDGQVLGLFEQLSAAPYSETPSKRKAHPSTGGYMLATPSKRLRSKDETNKGNLPQKAPVSGANSNSLDQLLTPPARRTMECTTPARRSATTNLRSDDTPAFLRRNSQRADVEKENVLEDKDIALWSPVVIRKLPKAAGRGLSALLKGLREMEDEGLDEEFDMLRDMENDIAFRNQLTQTKISINDGQRSEMPLGPDGDLETDQDDEEERKNNKSLKVWKKIGQKRTTRKVLMRPSNAKWRPEPAWKVGQADEDEDGVAETRTLCADRSSENSCGTDEFEGIKSSQGAMGAGSGKRHALDCGLEKRKGLGMNVKKKISAKTFTNFRALKIKNKQSKKKRGKFGQRW